MDNKLTYKDLKNMAKLAKEKNLCLAVEVTIPGQEETEIIINRPSSSVVDVEELLFEAYKGLDPKDVVGIK